MDNGNKRRSLIINLVYIQRGECVKAFSSFFILILLGALIIYKHCGHHGIDRILKVLLEKGVITQSDLQNIIYVRSGSLSEVLSKMEDKQLITREKDENDKRRVKIEITEKE